MAEMNRLFSASLDDLKRGYAEDKNCFECLFCGQKTEKGVIYQQEERYYDAERQLKDHLEKAHGSVFESLLGLDRKYTGLSDHQSQLLQLFYEGKNDLEVKKAMGIGSNSTIRNHRFALKEKERQAKLFLVLMELLSEKKTSSIVQTKELSRVAGTREITAEEEEIIKKFFPMGPDGPLKTFQIKDKSKIAVLKNLSKRFDREKVYTEKEVNEILKEAYEDFATLRRYLIEYDFMERKPDGSQYWLRFPKEELMTDRKELVQQYKETKKEAGVYQIRNTKNGKVWLASTPDLKTMNGKRFELQMGTHRCQTLQKDWNDLGEAAFRFETLEVLKDDDLSQMSKHDELKKLSEKWLEKLQPYGDKGYNKEGDR